MLNENIDAVQSGVQLMNHNTKWFCFLNVLEYFFWFKSSMHFFARIGMTPLGGNTVFVRRELMEQLVGGMKAASPKMQIWVFVSASPTPAYASSTTMSLLPARRHRIPS